MVIVIFGMPLSGKGTISNYIKEKYNFEHISTGELIRQEIKSGSKNGELMNNLISQGKFISDEMMFEMLSKKLDDVSKEQNIILDGFPRTINQLPMLNSLVKVDLIILVKVEVDVVLKRIEKRRVCTNCHASLIIDDLLENKCPFCDGDVYKRDDDNEQVYTTRLKEFNSLTMPVINQIAINSKLEAVDNSGKLEDTIKQVDLILNDLLSKKEVI